MGFLVPKFGLDAVGFCRRWQPAEAFVEVHYPLVEAPVDRRTRRPTTCHDDFRFKVALPSQN